MVIILNAPLKDFERGILYLSWEDSYFYKWQVETYLFQWRIQCPTEIKASGGLQECAEEDVSKADAHSASRTLERS